MLKAANWRPQQGQEAVLWFEGSIHSPNCQSKFGKFYIVCSMCYLRGRYKQLGGGGGINSDLTSGGNA